MNLILLCPKYSVDDKIHSSNVVKIRKKESKGVHWTIFEWFFTKKGLFLGFCGIVDDVSDIIFHIIALILLNFLAKRRKKGRFGWTTAAIFCLKYNVRHGCLLLLFYRVPETNNYGTLFSRRLSCLFSNSREPNTSKKCSKSVPKTGISFLFLEVCDCVAYVHSMFNYWVLKEYCC